MTLFSRRSAPTSVEHPRVPLNGGNLAKLLEWFGGGGPSAAGIEVTPATRGQGEDTATLIFEEPRTTEPEAEGT